MSYWQHLKKANFHRDFIRDSTILKILGYYPLEYSLLSRTISYPKIINFLVTLRCNLRCEICHTMDALTTSKKGELSLEEIYDLVEKCAQFGPDWHFSGGEPFARLDLPLILSRIKSLGMRSSVVSNGLLIHEKLLEKLEVGSLGSITLSVLGIREDHDKEVGKKGAYDLLRSNLEKFHQAMPGTAIYLNCPMTPGFIKRLKEFEADFRDFPIRAVKFTHLNYLTSDEIESYREYSTEADFKTHTAYSYRNDFPMEKIGEDVTSERFEDFSLPFQMIPQLRDDEIRTWYTKAFESRRPCHFIWHSTYLYPDGTIKSCHFLQEPFGNVRERDMVEIWNSAEYQNFRNQIKNRMSPACARCCKL
jgi:MoaA/NifB/PqqE/SkfB family radical SAM enzyme